MSAGLSINGAVVSDAEFYATALNPQQSVVVQACAGSGKTWMLAARVVRLLLAGAAPQSIVAITFTNKAAAEMKNRIYGWLEELALGDDEQRGRLLLEFCVPADEMPAAKERAKSLATQVLGANESLAVHTFHGWFLRLKSALPISDSQALFSTLNTSTALLEEDAWQRFLEQIARDPELLRTYAQFIADMGLESGEKALRVFIARRAEWLCYTESAADPVAHAMSDLSALHKDIRQATPEGFLQTHTESLRSLAKTFAESGGAYAIKAAEGIVESVMLAADPVRAADELALALLTQAGEYRTSIFNNKILKTDQATRQLYETVADAIKQVAQCQRAGQLLALHQSWYTLGHALVQAYEEEKAERGEADFSDLELMVARVLQDPAAGAGLQARLDAQVKHLLIDEFQDTNPLQWRIVRQWLAGYEGAGQRPSVFVVGDPKQSIYRFRRADPAIFPAAAEYFAQAFDAALLSTQRTRRNATEINAFVNRLFAQPAGPWGGEVVSVGPFALQVTQQTVAGCVEVFARLPCLEQAEPRLARNPLTEPLLDDEDSAHLTEARAVAAHLQALAAADAAWNWGEVLILTRARAPMSDLETAMREAAIPYESSRRGGLLDAPEVRDMQALATVLATPRADLKLAQVLRSPLFSFSDDDLIALWPSAGSDEEVNKPRGWAALAVSTQTHHAAASAALLQWQRWAGELPVHDVLDRIYASHNVLAKYAAAVPAQRTALAVGNLMRVLEMALDAHGGRYPSLSRFVQALEAFSRVESEDAPDEAVPDSSQSVLITTIHSAKGLERDVVVLFDTHRKWQQPARDASRALIVWPPTAFAPVHFSFDFAQAKTSARDHWQSDEEARERIEEGALLYVAATRAKKRLIVTGHEKRKPIKDSWWEMCAAQQAEQPWAETVSASAGQGALPQRANYVASVPFNPEPGYANLIRTDSAAAAAGIALHALLEVAAALPSGERNGAGELLCQRVARALALPLDEVQRAWQETQRVLQEPLLTLFFASEHAARTEWQLLAADGTLQRLDRVVWLPQATWVLDFKRIGDRTPPLEYAQQLLAYAATVRALEPGRPVRCAVITDLALLYELNSDSTQDSAEFVQITDAAQLQ